jgi:hypothetical protein
MFWKSLVVVCRYFWVAVEAVLNEYQPTENEPSRLHHIPKVPQCREYAGTEPRTVTLVSRQPRAVDQRSSFHPFFYFTGIYKPRLRCYDLHNLGMKFERCLDAEVVTFEILSDDYSKVITCANDAKFFNSAWTLKWSHSKFSPTIIPR